VDEPGSTAELSNLPAAHSPIPASVTPLKASDNPVMSTELRTKELSATRPSSLKGSNSWRARTRAKRPSASISRGPDWRLLQEGRQLAGRCAPAPITGPTVHSHSTNADWSQDATIRLAGKPFPSDFLASRPSGYHPPGWQGQPWPPVL